MKPYISAVRALATASIARYAALCLSRIASYTPGPTSSLRNTWVCASIIPGRSVAPPRSMTLAPGALAASSAAVPTATIASPSTSTAIPSRGRSETPSIRCAALIRVGEANAGALASRQARTILHMAGMLAPSAADCAANRAGHLTRCLPYTIIGDMLECLLRRRYDPAELLAAHPPRLRHPHKRLVFELACPTGARHSGSIELTRWAAARLPPTLALSPTDIAAVSGHYEYETRDGVWHVNFADPSLFCAYGSALLAQDELQAAEHPLLGPLREALVAEGQPAVTEDGGAPTPVLVAGVERRCAIATAPDPAAGRPGGLYGNRFAAASPEVVHAAVRVLQPPTRSNLIAIAAPCGSGPYQRDQIEGILVTAYTGFAAAVEESRRSWPGAAVEIRTGFWGCGAFGGNRHAMTLLQLLAARLAGVDRLRFYVFDEAGHASFRAGAADLARVLDTGAGESLTAAIDRIAGLGYQWGVSDGN